ncbi:MAG TPA: TIR domain-containing protein [Chthoniobacterales bacterium]|jgi:hypothetical protein
MAHVFISHSHRDAEASAEILAALEERGVKCWTAPRDVPPGGSYAEAILTAIENASCFVLVYTENSNVSPHVLREVERALSYGANIIPVRFDGSSVSKSLDYLLATVHWLSVVTEPRSKSIGEVAERIASCVVDRGEAPPVPRTPPPPAMPAAPPPPLPVTPQGGGSSLWLLWLGLVLLAIAGVIFAVQTVRHALPNETKTVATPTLTPTTEVATPQAAAIPPAVPVTAPSPSNPQTVETPAEVAVETPAPTPETTPIEESTVREWTPSPESTSSVAPVISHEAPLGVVHRYFSYLGDHNTIKAYELLSQDYRQRETFVVYTRSFAATEAIRLVSAKETSHSGRRATVSVTFDKQNQRFGWIRWHGPIELVLDTQGWRIDSVKALKPSSIRR